MPAGMNQIESVGAVPAYSPEASLLNGPSFDNYVVVRSNEDVRDIHDDVHRDVKKGQLLILPYKNARTYVLDGTFELI